MKKWLAGILAVLLLASCLLTGVSAEGTAPAPEQTEKTVSHRFTIQTEDMLKNMVNMDARAWDATVAREKSNGLRSPVTEETLKRENPDVRILKQNGRIYMIDGAKALGKVETAMDAYRAVYRLTGLLGAPEDAELRLWSSITAPSGIHVFVFQQVYEGLTVIASTVKIVTGEDGQVSAVFSSLSTGVPESTGVREIPAEEAEEIVRNYLSDQGFEDSVMPEYTSRAIMPLVSPLDEDAEEATPDRLVWIVYTENPRFADVLSVDLPYLAHYVGADGTYLHNTAVTMPGNSANQGGFPAEYAFEFMEKGEWSGTVAGHGETSMEITVPVMRDTRTGVWYLGDPERKIALGDFAALAYGDQTVHLISSPENGGWEDEDLITYYHLIKAWDFYAEMGWYGPDGIGTPILLLKGMCLKNGEDVFNAAYAGLLNGWQCFAYGKNTYLGQALDVFVHEFTHGVTTTLMNTNLYLNDNGAINEAMSDILGNLCEQIEETGDSRWLMGESSGTIIRSMLDPHLFEQPEHVWDLFYAPPTDTPNDMNDRGGVHINSSLLNLTAARLSMVYGMPPETAKVYWLTVASCMTPDMDYPQLAELLKWAVPVSGCEAYREAVDALIAQTRMSETGLPQSLPENRRLVRLALPDSGDIADDHWVLFALQVDLADIQRKVNDVTALLGAALKAWWGNDTDREALEKVSAEFRKNWKVDEILRALAENDEAALQVLIKEVVGSTAGQHMTWRSQDGTASMVLRDIPTLYLLINMNVEDDSPRGMAVLAGEKWYDLMTGLISEDGSDEQSKEMMDALTDDVIRMIDRYLFAAPQADGQEAGSKASEAPAVIDLPTAGLENLTLTVPEAEAEETPAE